MRPPVCSVADAVATVGDGDCVYLGNFGAQLFAVADELITQRRRELHAVVASGGLLLDRLIGAGVLARATYAHCWSPVGPDPAWHFRRLAQAGDRRVVRHEVSLGMLSAALTAAAWRVPFLPIPAPAGTGYLTEDWPNGMVTTVDTPFGSAPVVRALAPDVAFVHVDLADEWGNGVIRSPVGEALVAAQAARRVVLVAEELADHDRVRAAGITIPGVLVAMVVHHPGAVAPDGAIGRYPRDVPAYQRLVRQAAEAGP
ncbi:MAG TPA: CoA-transferase [Natronosporangium sp.]|jgi:glutaconate CoA-transferase subunit A|nr:CoA-transferase [Natronosporangium sp.]